MRYDADSTGIVAVQCGVSHDIAFGRNRRRRKYQISPAKSKPKVWNTVPTASFVQ